MSAAMELHVALSLRLDAIEAYRLAHAYRDEELLKAAARVEDAACDADFTHTPDYCTGLRAGGELLTQLACGENTTRPAAEVLPKADVVAWLVKKAREERAGSTRDDKVRADAISVLASKVERGAIRPDNLRMLPADFFEPGRTYAEPGDTTDWRFRCDAITTHPTDGKRTALGWRHFHGEWSEYAYGEDDFEIHQIANAIGSTQDGDA